MCTMWFQNSILYINLFFCDLTSLSVHLACCNFSCIFCFHLTIKGSFDGPKGWEGKEGMNKTKNVTKSSLDHQTFPDLNHFHCIWCVFRVKNERTSDLRVVPALWRGEEDHKGAGHKGQARRSLDIFYILVTCKMALFLGKIG